MNRSLPSRLPQLLLGLALLVLSSASLVAQSSSGDDPTLYSQLGKGGSVIAKGKQPASGLVVNVPSGFARIGLVAPEATFVGETLAATKARVISGAPKISCSAMGNHVANGAADPCKTPLRMSCSAKDDNDRVRIDLPSGYDLVLVDLITEDNQRMQYLVQAQAFFLDVDRFLELAKVGLRKVELRFFSSTNPRIHKISVDVDPAKDEAILEL